MQNIPVRLGFQGNPGGSAPAGTLSGFGPPPAAVVTGTIAGLLSSTHGIVSFDLGEAWNLYTLVQVIIFPVGPMTALNTVTVYGADAAGDNTVTARVLGIPGTATPSRAMATNLIPATGAQSMWVRPVGRFVVVDFFNQDGTNAAGATSAINFAAYPGA